MTMQNMRRETSVDFSRWLCFSPCRPPFPGVADDQPVPDGCSLRVPVQFLDSTQQAVARSWHDEEISDDDRAEQRRAQAYSDFKMRMNTAGNARGQAHER
jgi:hypothetical protein